MRHLAWILLCLMLAGGCVFSLDGSLVARKRDGGDASLDRGQHDGQHDGSTDAGSKEASPDAAR